MDQANPDGSVLADELATLAEIGRAIVEAQLAENQLCELIYELAGRIVPTESFQLGIFDGDCYRIKVWSRTERASPHVLRRAGGTRHHRLAAGGAPAASRGRF